MTVVEPKKICEVGGGGLFLPALGDEEQGWNKTMRAMLYLTGLFYLFMAVNIAADYFMSAVEAITSAKVRRLDKETDRWVTRKKWNDTVANLTLLALGSSAPEILLSCIEIAGNEFYSGELGPGTIVGSAAFNLLVIISVCIISIPEGEVRYIKAVAVYHITVIFSLFAYFWLLVMVTIWTPDIITIPEAIITLIMFPILVVISYFADIGKLDFMAFEKSPPGEEGSLDKAAEEKLRLRVGGGDEAAGGPPAPVEIKRAHHRQSVSTHKPQVVHPRVRRASMHLHHGSHHPSNSNLSVTFAADRGALQGHARDIVSVRDDEAQIDKEKGRTRGSLWKDATEPYGARDDGWICEEENGEVIANPHGVVSFRSDNVDVLVRNKPIDQRVQVVRRNGHSGKVTCKYRTESLSAVEGFDYERTEGKLEFADGETAKMLIVRILPKRVMENNDAFQLILEELEGGAQFNPNDDGGEDEALCTFNCINDTEKAKAGFCAKVKEWFDPDNFNYGMAAWIGQIKDSVAIDGEEGEDGEESKPGPTDYIVHVLSVPWKVLFAVISPPPNFCSGWLLFVMALFYIGAVTAVISDLASLFGCCADLEDSVTAITVVALGTSLPDMFASMSSAQADEHADASIVNVTGSNSVNVFLGIGLPWTCAALFWQSKGPTQEWRNKYPTQAREYPDGGFVVEAGTLGFSVLIFCSVALICLTTLRLRRLRFGGELGGPTLSKRASSLLLLLLWFTYIGCSIARVEGGDDAEVIQYPILGLAGLFFLLGLVNECCGKKSQPIPKAAPEEPKDIQAAQPISAVEPHKEELEPVVEASATQECDSQSPLARPPAAAEKESLAPARLSVSKLSREGEQSREEAAAPLKVKAKSAKKIQKSATKSLSEAEVDKASKEESPGSDEVIVVSQTVKSKGPRKERREKGEKGADSSSKKKRDAQPGNSSQGSKSRSGTPKAKEKD
mmetsp:Transcript_100569/g.260356  ORF Transcript_100569/g.260356 Transcript_100569/m.260356 type:complete len:959 (+) Transcript_100569:183-3059(+)